MGLKKWRMVGAKRDLSPATYREWLASARAIGADRVPGPLLAWARTADAGVCITSRGFLSVQMHGAETADGPGEGWWKHLGWHEIERGSFSAENRRLSWTTYDAGPGHVLLAESGRVPEVFRERVAASIMVEEFIPLDDGTDTQRGVIVSGRRDLSRQAPEIIWHASLPDGVTAETPGIEDLADAAVERLRAEYDPRS